MIMWGSWTAWFISLPAVCGLIELWKRISFQFMRYRNETAFTLVPIKGGEDTEFILRGVINRVKWLEGTGHEIWILNCGMDSTSEQVCRKMTENYPALKIITPIQLEERIKDFYKDNKY